MHGATGGSAPDLRRSAIHTLRPVVSSRIVLVPTISPVEIADRVKKWLRPDQ